MWIVGSECDVLGRPHACMYCHQQHDVVAATDPLVLIRSLEERLDLVGIEDIDVPAGPSLCRNCQNPLGQSRVGWLA